MISYYDHVTKEYLYDFSAKIIACNNQTLTIKSTNLYWCEFKFDKYKYVILGTNVLIIDALITPQIGVLYIDKPITTKIGSNIKITKVIKHDHV
jgi:hypothetical protein